jgi:hypothetical protein
MKVTGFSLLLAAQAAVAAPAENEKRQIAGLFGALAAGDTAVLGALGSELPLKNDL